MKKKFTYSTIPTVPIPSDKIKEVDFFIEKLAELLLKQVEVKNENKNEKRRIHQIV